MATCVWGVGVGVGGGGQITRTAYEVVVVATQKIIETNLLPHFLTPLSVSSVTLY